MINKTYPIFIHGILRRSGTNMLHQIILKHPSCIQPRLKVREDWFVHFSDELWGYCTKLFGLWHNPKWQGELFNEDLLYEKIGEGLLSFLSAGLPSDPCNLLTKTPSFAHLNRCHQLFPSAKPVLIVRHPWDLAASAYKTWAVPVKETLKQWENALQELIEYEKCSAAENYLLIRYEDLVSQTITETRNCLDFLKLETSVFPWDELDSLPVFGSSSGEKLWQAEQKNASFSPFDRWKELPEDSVQTLLTTNLPGMDYLGYARAPEKKLTFLPSKKDRQLIGATVVKEKLARERDASDGEKAFSRKEELTTGIKKVLKGLIGYKTLQKIKRHTKANRQT